jgi:hypothetical protein
MTVSGRRKRISYERMEQSRKEREKGGREEQMTVSGRRKRISYERMEQSRKEREKGGTKGVRSRREEEYGGGGCRREGEAEGKVEQ